MEHRLKKLLNEQDRLDRQMKKAQNTSDFADECNGRRNTDNSNRNNWLDNIEQNRQHQNYLNNMRKNDTETTIKNERGRVRQENSDSRQYVGSNSN